MHHFQLRAAVGLYCLYNGDSHRPVSLQAERPSIARAWKALASGRREHYRQRQVVHVNKSLTDPLDVVRGAPDPYLDAKVLVQMAYTLQSREQKWVGGWVIVSHLSCLHILSIDGTWIEGGYIGQSPRPPSEEHHTRGHCHRPVVARLDSCN